MPAADEGCAEKVTKRICDTIEEAYIEDEETKIRLTLSLGVACMENSDTDISLESLIMRTDQALYAAKADGRNQVEIWDKSFN